MKFIELFAGIGGFRLGLEKSNTEKIKNRNSYKRKIRKSETRIQPDRNGDRNKRGSADIRSGLWQVDNGYFKCIWANEIEKCACQIYRKNFGKKELVKGDIRWIPAESIPDHDLLTAGFPCQSFSIAGKRKGFGDTRGTLFFEICRIVEAKKPDLLLLENVKGLLNHDGGDTFRIILNSLSELGYDCEWEVLNSKNFGVPQNRERVFIVGHLRGQSRGKVFPIGKANEIHNGKGQAELDPKGYNEDLTDFGRVPLVNGDSEGHSKEKNKEKQPGSVKIGLMGGERENGVAYCLRKNECNAIKIKTIGCFNKVPFGQANKVYDSGGISPTIASGQDDFIPSITVNDRIRRLTPTECERIQGFPDKWTEGPPAESWWLDKITDKQRYECLGNAVTVNVIEEIGRSILRWTSSRKG